MARATVRESRADVNGVWGGAPAAGGQRGLGRSPSRRRPAGSGAAAPVGCGAEPREKKSTILGPKTATFSSRNGYHTHLTYMDMDMDMDMDMVCSNDKSAAFEAATASLKFTCGAVTLGYR